MTRTPELREMVFRVMGAGDFETPLEKAAHPAVWAYLNSGYHDAETPILHMNHNRLKLPEEHLQKHFSLKKLKEIVLEIPEIQRHLKERPEEKKEFNGVFQDAVFFHQVKSPFYWKKAGGDEYLKNISAAAEGVPQDMNEHNAETAAETAHQLLLKRKKGFVTILDVGTGTGGTIIPVLRKLAARHPDALSRTRVVLNCVQPNLKEVKEKLEDLGVSWKNVVLVPTTFYAFSQAMGVRGMPEEHPWPFADSETLRKIKGMKGKIDVIVSGATLNNLPRSSLAFDTLYALLSKGGRALLWDWGAFDLAKKEYSKKELNRDIKTIGRKRVTVGDNIKGFWRFWLYHHGYIDPKKFDNKAWEKFEHYFNSSPKIDVYGWFEKNFSELEKLRGNRDFTTMGFANRAYRTPEDVARAASHAGFKVNEISFPLASHGQSGDAKFNWIKPNPRFVTWHADLQKTSSGGFKHAFYSVAKALKIVRK